MRKIGIRLMMAFTCIIIFLILQGAFAFMGFRELETAYQNAFSHSAEMDLLRADLAETRLLIYSFISTLNPEIMDENRKTIEENLQRIDAMLSTHGINEALITKNAALYRQIMDLHANFYTKTARQLLSTTSNDTHNRLFTEMQNHAGMMADRHKNQVAYTRQKTLWITFGLLVAALLVAGGWALVLMTTLTDRRKAERALQESESRLRAIFNAVENVSFIITDANDPEPCITEFSPGAEKIFGYQKAEMIGRPVSLLHLKKNMEKLLETFKQMRQGKTGYSGEITMIRKSGEHFPAIFALYPLYDPDGVLEAILGVSVDISERKALEAQLQQAHKMEAIGTLAGGIAHDFNNILSIIIGNAELGMENFPKDHPGRGNLEEILTAGLRARDVVRQLLNYSRKSVAHKQTVDMAALIEANKNLIRSSIPTTIDIHYHMEPSLPPVNADKIQMYQVLLNLTTNAAAAMESAGGRMDIELSRVRIADADHNNVYGLKPGKYLSLAVRDTGCGIPPDIIDRIFDPYFTTREAGKGSGMGLAVVHGIVEYHGGGIHVESAPEKGTEVRLLLPEANDKTVRPDAGGTTTSGGSGRILFVDDEPSIAEVNRQLLERYGYQVQAFTDPETAVREFSRHPDDFDLVVSDMTMPKMTGDRLAAEIRKLRPEMPVILCTGFSERMDEGKAKTMGISEFLIKPVGIEKLVQTIRKMMSDE